MPALGLLKDKTRTSNVVGENCLAKASGSLEVSDQAKAKLRLKLMLKMRKCLGSLNMVQKRLDRAKP